MYRKVPRSFFGEVTERPKVHDWKSCVSQGTAGSNPAFSAIFIRGSTDCEFFNAVEKFGIGNEEAEGPRS